jgi:alkylation response protein AidB-like acyl-CoA dehydrogenase
MTDEDFRAEVRAFIANNLPEEMGRRGQLGYHPHKPDVEYWTRVLDARGWSVPHWPVEHGGPGWTSAQRHIFEEECFGAGCPEVSPQGLHLVGPILISRGSEAQKAEFLPKIRNGEHFWTQGFSEPNAGSDLGNLQTRAVRDGDDYVVNGQKIWTSQAHYSDWLFLLVRTGTVGKPQEGISFLLVDMTTPGIIVRPIISIDGGHILNEVFLDEVRVPVENLVGEENEGWTYAKELLGLERTLSAEVPRLKAMLARLKRIAEKIEVRGRPLSEDPHFARRLGLLDISFLSHEATMLRVMAEEEAGMAAGPTASILKVCGTELLQRIGALTVEALGDEGLPAYLEADYLLATPADAPGSPLAPGVTADFFYRRATTIYGGANEIQRNIIAGELLRG